MLGHIVYIFFVSTYLSSVSTPDINNQRFPISPQDMDAKLAEQIVLVEAGQKPSTYCQLAFFSWIMDFQAYLQD